MIREKDRLLRGQNSNLIIRALREILELHLEENFIFDFQERNAIHFRCRKSDIEKAHRAVLPLIESGQFYLLGGQGGEGWFSIVPMHMNKGDPVLFLQKKHFLDPDNIVIAGDEGNDMPMLEPRVAKHRVCPSNAADEIKKRVRKHGGVVASKKYSWGVIEAVAPIVERLIGNRG